METLSLKNERRTQSPNVQKGPREVSRREGPSEKGEEGGPAKNNWGQGDQIEEDWMKGLFDVKKAAIE